MKRKTTRWLAIAGLIALPYALLVIAGSLWLYEHGWLWQWLAIGGATTLVGGWLVRYWRTQLPPPRIAPVQPDAAWSPSGQEAWRDVEAIAARVQNEDLPLDRLDPLWNVVREVLDVVARRYRPQSKQPALEIPLPYVLRVIELVAQDFRHAISDNIPGSHILTLNDFQRTKQLATLGRRLYFLYRVISFGFNPAAGVAREMRDMAGSQLVDATTAEVKRWAVDYCVRKAGYYAIQLYSGQLVLSDVDFNAYQTGRSLEDLDVAQRRDATLAAEPLRILVLGQVKAGKSSLINALFGETRSAVDVVPRTRHVEPYLLEREGMQRAIILDTAGYADNADRAPPFAAARAEILRSDLVLMVCSAASAARDADRRLLDELRAFFQSAPDRLLPPLVVVLSHVDRLRPWNEWQPPYDLQRADTPKAKNIADAVRAVADDLAVEAGQVVPTCLLPERLYNVAEALVPLILTSLSEAQRVKYLRCLRQFHDEEYWRRLWQQTLRSGRLLLQAVAATRPTRGE